MIRRLRYVETRDPTRIGQLKEEGDAGRARQVLGWL